MAAAVHTETPERASIRQAARWIGVSRQRICAAADRGEIPFSQPGRRTKFVKLEDVRAWLDRYQGEPAHPLPKRFLDRRLAGSSVGGGE